MDDVTKLLLVRLALYVALLFVLHRWVFKQSYNPLRPILAGAARLLMGILIMAGTFVVCLGLDGMKDPLADVLRTGTVWILRAVAWHQACYWMVHATEREGKRFWIGAVLGLALNIAIDFAAFKSGLGPPRTGPFAPTLGFWNPGLC